MDQALLALPFGNVLAQLPVRCGTFMFFQEHLSVSLLVEK